MPTISHAPRAPDHLPCNQCTSALTALLITSIKSLTPSSTPTSSDDITGYLFYLLCCTFPN